MQNHNFNGSKDNSKYGYKDYDHYYNKDSKEHNHERSPIPFFIGIVLFISTVVFILIF